jgi:hypothetical protein
MTFKQLQLDVAALVHGLFVGKGELVAREDYRSVPTERVGMFAAAYLSSQYWNH